MPATSPTSRAADFAWSDSRASARGFSDGVMLTPRARRPWSRLSKPEDAAGFAYQKESLNLAVAQLAAHKISARSEQLA